MNRHHVSNSGPMLCSSPITATRSPGRHRRSTEINSGNRPDAKVFRPISRLISVLIGMGHFKVPRALGDRFVISRDLLRPNPLIRSRTLTATSEMKMCSGLPSAVPRCSVEMRIGPAFL